MKSGGCKPGIKSAFVDLMDRQPLNQISITKRAVSAYNLHADFEIGARVFASRLSCDVQASLLVMDPQKAKVYIYLIINDGKKREKEIERRKREESNQKVFAAC